MRWRRLIPPLWMTSVLWFLLIGAIVVGVVSCGDDDSGPIDDPTWTVTHDPYGREWACLLVADGSYAGGGLFCAPAPESP